METYQCYEQLLYKYCELRIREWNEDWLERLYRTGLLRAIFVEQEKRYYFCEMDLVKLLSFWPRQTDAVITR